jgi:hypothetical protein
MGRKRDSEEGTHLVLKRRGRCIKHYRTPTALGNGAERLQVVIVTNEKAAQSATIARAPVQQLYATVNDDPATEDEREIAGDGEEGGGGQSIRSQKKGIGALVRTVDDAMTDDASCVV